MSKKKAPRGIRNKNPLNIRRGKVAWVGEIHPLNEYGEETEKVFCVFQNFFYGWRAVFSLFRTYMEKHNCRTIRHIIRRWAPENENNTEAYINYVTYMTGINRDFVLSFDSDYSQLAHIAIAMCQYENGVVVDSGHISNKACLLQAYLCVKYNLNAHKMCEQLEFHDIVLCE